MTSVRYDQKVVQLTAKITEKTRDQKYNGLMDSRKHIIGTPKEGDKIITTWICAQSRKRIIIKT